MYFIYVKTPRKNSKFSVFDRSNVCLDWSKKLENSQKTIFLAWLVLDCCSIDWKRTFDRLTSNRISIESNLTIYLARLVLDRCSIDRKRIFEWSTSNRISIEPNRLVTISLDRSKLMKLKFSRIFLKQFSTVFHEQTTII